MHRYQQQLTRFSSKPQSKYFLYIERDKNPFQTFPKKTKLFFHLGVVGRESFHPFQNMEIATLTKNKSVRSQGQIVEQRLPRSPKDSLAATEGGGFRVAVGGSITGASRHLPVATKRVHNNKLKNWKNSTWFKLSIFKSLRKDK